MLDLVVSQVIPAKQGVVIVRLHEDSPLESTRRAQKVQYDQVYSKMALRWQYNIRTMSTLSIKAHLCDESLPQYQKVVVAARKEMNAAVQDKTLA